MTRRAWLAGTALATATAGVAFAADAATPRARRLPVRLSGNENPWGPGPMARAAIAESIADGSRYGIEHYTRLIEAVAAHERVDRDRIVIGSGSGELLHMLALAYCDRGQIVCAWPTFNQLMAFAEKLGCEVRRVPLDAGMRHDLAALDAATRPDTSLLYLCNPNNPTGTVVPGDALRALCERAARATLVVVDEAYLEFAEPGSTAGMVDLVRADANVAVLRTFSKIHGMAGLRIGYAVARPDVAARLRRFQMAFPNLPGVRAATASLGDEAFLSRTRAALLADRQRMCDALREVGLRFTPSQANFVFADVGMPSEEFRKRMLAQQVEVGRPFEPYREWSRISVGTTDDTTFFIDALRRAIKG